jgi:hypothetical protein
MPPERLYHLSRDGKPLGKLTEVEMRERLRAGKLKPNDDYWTHGMRAWAKLAILPPRRPVTTNLQIVPSSLTKTTVSHSQLNHAAKSRKPWRLPALIVLVLIAGYILTVSMNTDHRRARGVWAESGSGEARSERIEFTNGFAPFHPMGKELFPSHIIACANTGFKPKKAGADESPHYGHPDFLIGVLISGPTQGDRITIEVVADHFILPSSASFTVKENARLVTAGVPPQFDFNALSKVRQTFPFNVTVKIKRNEEAVVIFTEVWQVHQINDWLNRFSLLTASADKGVASKWHSGGSLLAGYVNENHPMIDQILAEAKATKISSSFTGYGDGKNDIRKQIEAIWTALQKRGITYSNTADSTHSPMHSFQHIRMLDQCLTSGQANCIDATVMLAAVLKKIGLNVGIILVPNHAYLVVYDKTGKKREFAIESTGIPNRKLSEAIKVATEEDADSLRKVEDRLDDGSDDKYHEVVIEDCRRAGIQPIPYSP